MLMSLKVRGQTSRAFNSALLLIVMMRRTYLKGGIKISELGFGAWQLGVESGWQAVSSDEADRMIRTALDEGINFFDTAPNYGHGTSESRLGNVLGSLDRGTIVVNSKFGRLDTGEVDFSADLIRGSVERSLKRLKMEYLDSVIIHSPPAELLDGNKNDHYDVLERLVEEGKILAYGASVDAQDEITTLLTTTNAKVIQSFFNILHQDCTGAFDMVNEKGATVIAKIPFDSGWLTGKYSAASQFTGVRARWSEDEIEQRAELVDRVVQILGDEVPLITAALLFCTSFEEVSTVIPGAVSVAQLQSNIRSMQDSLDPALRDALVTFFEQEVRALRLPC